MIKIQVKKKNNNFSSIIVNGHSGYDNFGQDIVCAGISTLTIAIFNGITEVCKIKRAEIKEDDGFLSLKLPDDLSDDEYEKTNVLLETLILAYQQLSELYPKEVKLVR